MVFRLLIAKLRFTDEFVVFDVETIRERMSFGDADSGSLHGLKTIKVIVEKANGIAMKRLAVRAQVDAHGLAEFPLAIAEVFAQKRFIRFG